MNKEQFFNAVVDAVRNEIPEDLRNEITVNVRKVIKTNDEVLHGISLVVEGYNCAPTIYLEECFDEFKKGVPLPEIAEGVIVSSLQGYNTAPVFENLSLEYEDIQDKLSIQVVDGAMNRDRLKDLVYQPVGNGFVAIPYIVMSEDENKRMVAAVSKTMVKEMKYDVDKLLETAFLNTAECNEPVFFGMESMMLMEDKPEISNPMKEGFEIDPNLGMYVLTNSTQQNGASVLFYPEMQKRIGEVLGNNYYVLPSSLHEVIIVPEKTAPPLYDLKVMVRGANRTVVEPQDVLSDKVLFYDRDKNKLIEPKVQERSGDERGDR